MVFLVIGKSFSGKTFFIENLRKDKEFCEKYNLKELVEYTTRKPRAGECDRVGHYFISEEEYKNRFENNPSAIVTHFNSEYGLLHYITDLSNLNENKNYIVSGNIKMIPQMKEILGNQLCIICLMSPNYILFSRFCNRVENKEYTDKKWKEIYRRFFDDLEVYSKYVNEYFANVDSFTILDKDYKIDQVKKWMSVFTLTNKMDDQHIALFYEKGGHVNGLLSDYDYEEYELDRKEMINGHIIFRNELFIDTEQSRVRYI